MLDIKIFNFKSLLDGDDQGFSTDYLSGNYQKVCRKNIGVIPVLSPLF